MALGPAPRNRAQAGQQRAGREPDRVNPVMALFGRASPDREFYQAVYRRLVELYPLPPNALQELAAHRAGAIVEYLAGSASIETAAEEHRNKLGEPVGLDLTQTPGARETLEHRHRSAREPAAQFQDPCPGQKSDRGTVSGGRGP
jgi:hypothetical protein